MARTSIPVALPPFRGLTRRIVLVVVGFWLMMLLLSLKKPDIAALIVSRFSMRPDEVLGRQIWELFTYPFVYLPGEVFAILLGVLSFWFFASELESDRGYVWLAEFLGFASVVGGFLAVLLTRFVVSRWEPIQMAGYEYGLTAVNIALVLAYARFYPERELSFNFVLRLKAKYLAAIYVLVYMANALTTAQHYNALVAVCVGVCGLVYIKLAPARGLRFLVSERWYGLRNSFYRNKRRRAAKKFTVYMKKQGKEVNLDASGRYISLEDEQRDPNDPRWRN